MDSPMLGAVLEIDKESDEEADVEDAKYVVADCKLRSGGRVSRLHLREGCHLGRTLSFASYELIHADPPPARAYIDFCKRCWPRGPQMQMWLR